MRWLIAALVVAALAPGAAPGATVSIDSDRDAVIFQASPLETNQVVMTLARGVPSAGLDRVRFLDNTALVLPGPGCTAFDLNVVFCDLGEPALMWSYEVRLDSGNDSFTGAGVCPAAEGECFTEVFGGPGNDLLVGTEGVDYLRGAEGDDELRGGAGLCRSPAGLCGDQLYGGDGADRLYGGGGPDALDGGGGADVLQGGSGRDFATYRARAAAVAVDIDRVADDGEQGEGDNVELDVEAVYGGSGPDRLRGSTRRDWLTGGTGNDLIWGGGGNDRLEGDAGRDTISGGTGNDRIVGGPANVRAAALPEGPPGRDRLFGGPGRDSFGANDGRPDSVVGGPGRDRATVDRRGDRVRGVELVRASRSL